MIRAHFIAYVRPTRKFVCLKTRKSFGHVWLHNIVVQIKKRLFSLRTNAALKTFQEVSSKAPVFILILPTYICRTQKIVRNIEVKRKLLIVASILSLQAIETNLV